MVKASLNILMPVQCLRPNVVVLLLPSIIRAGVKTRKFPRYICLHLPLFDIYMKGYVWLCMAIKGYVGQCMAVYAYVGLCRAKYRYVGLRRAMHGYVWLCMAV